MLLFKRLLISKQHLKVFISHLIETQFVGIFEIPELKSVPAKI